MRNLIIFGGSFDPPHLGHKNITNQVEQNFKFDEFILLPCYQQPLKDTHFSSPEHRIAMLKIAFREKLYHLDLREIQKPQPSYTVNTLKEFRKQIGANDSITLLIGMDSFYEFHKWQKYQEILNLANLLIVNRGPAQEKLPDDLNNLLNQHYIENVSNKIPAPFGLITFFDAGSYDISSTKLREMIVKSELTEHNYKQYLSDEVYEYIVKYNLYQQ